MSLFQLSNAPAFCSVPTGGYEGLNQEEMNSPPAVTTAFAKKGAKHEGNMYFPTDIGYTLPTYFS